MVVGRSGERGDSAEEREWATMVVRLGLGEEREFGFRSEKEEREEGNAMVVVVVGVEEWPFGHQNSLYLKIN